MKKVRQQTGQLFQRHGSWYVRFYEDRVIDSTVKRVRISKRLGDVRTRGKTAPEEIRRLAKQLVETANDPQIDPELVMRLGDFVERAYFPRIQQHKRPSTVKGYSHIWRIHLKPRCSEAWMKDVRCHHVQQWLDAIARPGNLSKRSIQHVKCCLSAIFKLAKQQGYFVGENPVRDSAVAPDAKAPQPTYAYSLDEILAFLAVLPEPAATIFATAAFAGLRRGEIRGVRWEDYGAGEIQVAQSVWESHVSAPKTNQSRGSVPVIRPLAQMLEAHRMRCGNPSTGPIFAAVNGKPLNLNNVLRRMILPVLERCEVCRVSKDKHVGAEHKFVRDKSFPRWHGWHAARRGLGTNLYRLGVPEKIIQAILRHANVSTTNTYYIKTASADAQAAMAKLESVIPQLGNNWATESDSLKTSVAVN